MQKFDIAKIDSNSTKLTAKKILQQKLTANNRLQQEITRSDRINASTHQGMPKPIH